MFIMKIIIVAIVLVILMGIKIIHQTHRGIVETWGKYNRYLNPGLNWIIPFMETVKMRDIRSHTLDIPAQPVITKDNVEIQVDGIIWAKPIAAEESIKKTYYSIDNWKYAVMQLAQTNLRQQFGDLTLDESLTARQKISENLEKDLDKTAEEWGINIDKVEIKLIDPPEDIKQAMHKQKTAEQNRRAMKLEATGRYEAAEQDKLAAIQLAEGQREAEIKTAEGTAKAIELVNEAAQKYFKGNAVELRRIEMVERSLKNNAKIIIAKDGINPQIILGNIPTDAPEKVGKK